MLCADHHKLVEGPCILCGTPLCNQCATKKEGRKFYCRFCSEKTANIPKRESVPVKNEIKTQEAISKVLARSKTGYFDFSVIKKTGK